MIILSVALWKAVLVPVLIVFGVAGFILRGLVELAENFDTGYGPQSKRANRQAVAILVVFLLIAAGVAFLA